jgi:hypothetical protein
MPVKDRGCLGKLQQFERVGGALDVEPAVFLVGTGTDSGAESVRDELSAKTDAQ